ncbi:hypothetical protein Q5425_34500 [Amycolatopsis sp. A133]|uniref:hypothetical protein n=1 Tax=Amycolatopsis sp. A133 TaxID=3064472 RepID=UPI0027F36D36|nr:hypothetical protein [Amycolatopsis sp. A133]MDQ7808876.1 hypothetical protein [Amycolatopsis sp. A133]
MAELTAGLVAENPVTVGEAAIATAHRDDRRTRSRPSRSCRDGARGRYPKDLDDIERLGVAYQVTGGG